MSADAPRTKARFICNITEKNSLSFYFHTTRHMIPASLCSNSLPYFIDHRVCERLLVSSGSFAVVHVHRHHPDPRLPLFARDVTFSSARPSVLVLDLQPRNTLDK